MNSASDRYNSALDGVNPYHKMRKSQKRNIYFCKKVKGSLYVEDLP
jgi:hypothetical protein